MHKALVKLGTVFLVYALWTGIDLFLQALLDELLFISVKSLLRIESRFLFQRSGGEDLVRHFLDLGTVSYLFCKVVKLLLFALVVTFLLFIVIPHIAYHIRSNFNIFKIMISLCCGKLFRLCSLSTSLLLVFTDKLLNCLSSAVAVVPVIAVLFNSGGVIGRSRINRFVACGCFGNIIVNFFVVFVSFGFFGRLFLLNGSSLFSLLFSLFRIGKGIEISAHFLQITFKTGNIAAGICACIRIYRVKDIVAVVFH